jgi:hypothetical protein
VARSTGIALLAFAPAGCVGAAVMGGGALAGGVIGVAISHDRLAEGVGRGAAVDVTFDARRDVVALDERRGDTVRLRAVDHVVGVATAVRGDTLLLQLTEARGLEAPATFPLNRGPAAALVVGPGVTVRVLSARASETTWVVVGAVVVSVLAVVVFLYAALSGEDT